MPRYIIRRSMVHPHRIVAIDTVTARHGWLGDTVWEGLPSECPDYIRADARDPNGYLSNVDSGD